MNIDTLRKKYPGYSDDEILTGLQATAYPDYSVEEIKQAIGYKPRTRNVAAVANDLVIEAANAAAGGVSSAANFVSPGNRFSQFIDENIVKAGEEKQSDFAKDAKARMRAGIENAQGVGDELAAVGGYVTDAPGLAVAQAAGSFVGPGAAIKGSGLLAQAAGAGARGAARAGMAGGSVAGGAMAGGDAAQTAYELVKKAGGTEEQAQAAARDASLIPALIGAAGGVIGAERLFAGAAGPAGGVLRRAAVTGGTEALQEGIEEGVTQFEGQRAAVPYDPTLDPTKGVAAAAGLGAVLGGVTGAGVSLITRDAQRADATKRLADAKNLDEAIAAANDLAMPPAGLLDQARGFSAAREAQVLGGMEAQADADLKGIRRAGFMDPTGLPPQPTRTGAAPATGSAEFIDSPLADRILTVREQLADPAVREQIRALQPELLNEAAYYVNQADNAAGIPEATRDRLLAVAETIIQRATLREMENAKPLGTRAFTGPAQLAGAQAVPQIGLDTAQTGTVRVDSAGNAAPETRADAISTAQRVAEMRERRRTQGMEGQTQRDQMRGAGPGVMVGDGTITTPDRPARPARAVPQLTNEGNDRVPVGTGLGPRASGDGAPADGGRGMDADGRPADAPAGQVPTGDVDAAAPTSDAGLGAVRDDATLSDLQAAWRDAANRGDSMAAKAINDRIVEMKARTLKRESIDAAAGEAATSPENDRPEPTDAQKEAGNYKKGHARISGLDVTIENPKGSVRRSKADEPTKWEVTMPAHYGYIKGTKGADGDHVDLFIGDGGDNGRFWIINQTTPGGKKFDEHKVVTGVNSADEAVRLYKQSFADNFGDKVFSSISAEVDADALKARLPEMETAKPVPASEQTESRSQPAQARLEPAADEAPSRQPATESSAPQTNPSRQGEGQGQTGLASANDSAATLRERVERTRKPKGEVTQAPGRDVVPEGLFVTFGGKTFKVDSIEDAQRKWVQFQETAGAGVSEVGNGVEVVDGAGRKVGRISYNGRAWDAADNLIAEAPPPQPEVNAAPAAEAVAEAFIFTGKSALFDGYGASTGSTAEGTRRQLMVDPSGGYYWGEWRQESQRDVGAVAGGADASGTPASFPTSAEARAAAAATPKSKQGPTPPLAERVERTRKKAAEPAPAPAPAAAPSPAAEQPERFEAGRALTKEQRKQVLGTLVDVYKAKGAPREMKGQGRDGNERYGYVHSPELFEKSDITGAMVRYYVTLPDGRRAHPSELFPDYTQSDIEAEMQRRESAERADSDEQRRAEERFDKFAAATPAEAEASFRQRNTGPWEKDWRTGAVRTLVPFEKGGKFYATTNDDAGQMARLERAGWKRAAPAAEKPKAERAAAPPPQPEKALTSADIPRGPAGDEMLRAMPIGTKEEAAAFVAAYKQWLAANNAYGMGAMTPKNAKPATLRAPDLMQKVREATDKAEANYWQMPYEQARRRFDGLPRAKWEAERTKRGLPTDDAQPEKAEKQAAGKIDDFGEKLAGARKDYATTLKDAESLDVATEPLSKSWPEPDYQKLLDGGADPYMVAFIHAARDEVPTKPQKGWKLKGWVAQTTMLRDMARKMLDGTVSKTRLMELLASDQFRLVRNQVGGRAELYEAIGHGYSLKGITFAENHYAWYRGQDNVTKWAIEQKAKATAFSNWPRELAIADTKDEALRIFKEKIGSLDLGRQAKGQPQFVIYRKRGQEGAWIGKKIGREYIDLKKTADVAAARAYMAENLPELEAALEKYKTTPFERNTENRPRVGDDHRGGAQVTPQVFAETFGFRGVQFGNYVEQGRRQSDLNEAYDGLMDLAAVLGVPPRALSLNGRLGLAFGARGKGGKNAPAAHFEPGNIVINLTKGGGPGSLAHEWWHSLDNYFARQSTEGSSGFVTESASDAKLRNEMRAAFAAVRSATGLASMQQRFTELDKRRSKPYWNTPAERSARSFESYVIAKLADQGAANDYLANVVSQEAWEVDEKMRADFFGEKGKPSYPYPVADEMPAVRAAFDEFFKAVETRDTDRGTEMFSVADDAGQRDTAPDGQASPRHQQLAAEYQRLLQGRFPGTVFDAVPAGSGAGSGPAGDGVPGSRSRERAAVVTVAKRLFGHEVVFVRFPEGSKPLFNGAMSDEMPGVVFINADARKPMMAVLGHELVHQMATGQKALYQILARRLNTVLKNEQQYIDLLDLKYTPEQRKGLKYGEELHADVVGDFFMEPKFWQDMAAEQPSLFKRVAQAIIRFLDNAIGKIADIRPFGTEQYITDLNAARAAVVDAMRQFSGAEVGAMTSQSEGVNLSVADESPANTARTAQDLIDAKGGVFDFNRMGKTGQDRVRTVMDGSRPFWLGALTRDQIADIYGKEIPPVQEYDTLTRAMENERQKMAQDADDLYSDWAKIDAQANARLARVMLDATVHQVHPDGEFKEINGADNAERRQVHARIATEFKLLPNDAQAMYGRVKVFHERTLIKLREAIEGRIARQVENGKARAAALLNIRKMFDRYMENGPYFPLSRFGDFLVIATRGDNDRVVATYATAGEQQAAARRLQDEGFTVKLKTSKTYSREMDGSAGKFIGDVLATVGSLDFNEATVGANATNLKSQMLDDLNQMFIRALPDLSYRKHFLHRKNTPGFSSDVMRGFASAAFHSASHISRLNHGDKMTFALQDAYQQIENAPEGDFNLHSQVLNELSKRHDAMLNPNTHPIASMLNSVGFVMYLGMSPAAGLVNMLQTVMVTMPHLGARYGFGKANASLAGALKDITAAKANAKNGWNAAQSPKLSAAERAMMTELQDEGVIDLTQAHDLASATGIDSGNVARSKAAFAMSRAMKIVGWTFHIPEVMNRQVTALSAYRLEMEKSGNEAAAKDAAREAIKRTHFDYSGSNRARYMQGNLARVVMQFRQYAQNMTYLLGRAAHQALLGESPEVRSIARRQLVATMGVTFGMAGALGLPGIGSVAGLIGMMVGAMDDDDKPWDWKVEMRNALADTFGQQAGEVIAHGIPRALMPWDIAGRVGMGELWWRSNDREGQNPREAFANDMQNILGPTAGSVLGFYTAADHMARGNWSKAAESVVPKFLRDPLKAMREGQDGVTTYTGEPLMDLEPSEIVGRLLGFAPARTSEIFEARNAVKNAETAITEKRQMLLSSMVKARLDRDMETVRELQADITEFNRRNPAFRITGESISRGVMTKMRNRANTRDGILVPRTREELRDIGRFATTE